MTVTKIVRRSVLKGILDELRGKGKRIVFTNGCFDILHIGHLRYLQEAKALGDYLVVGVNTDESVRQLKGPDRPLVPQFERAEILSGLECVDYVTLFSETTPVALIGELKPDIHVKGGDYTADELPEAEIVKSYGGEVRILQEVEGKSTTSLVNRVMECDPRKPSPPTPLPSERERGGATPLSLSEGRGVGGEGFRRTAIGIIPARLAATRLPNKPLLDIAGKPMIQWVYEHAREASLLTDVLVATPDEEIFEAVESFGGKAIMTSEAHRSGTDRLAEAVQFEGCPDAEVIINIQGDEPLLDPAAIDLLAEAILADPAIPMASLMCPLPEDEENDPSVVKVVTDLQGFALYFSRAGIPYPRHPAQAWKHIGLYAYTREFLLTFPALAPTPLEQAESLEQLRALENGYRIRMVETDFAPTSVDTPDDLERVRRILEQT